MNIEADPAGLQSEPVLGCVRLSVRVSASSNDDALPGVASWSGLISVHLPDADFGAALGTMTLQAVDLRAGSSLLLTCDDYTGELGLIAAMLIDARTGECRVLDTPGPTAGTMVVVEDILLPSAWRGTGIGPAAARVAASLIANDLALIAMIPGDIDTNECPQTGVAICTEHDGTTDAFDKVLFAFAASGFDELPGSDGLLLDIASNPGFPGALQSALWTLARIPLTPARIAWLDDYANLPSVTFDFE